MTIRTSALIACIAATSGLLLQAWDATQKMFAIPTTDPLWKWWIIPAAILVDLFTAILPALKAGHHLPADYVLPSDKWRAGPTPSRFETASRDDPGCGHRMGLSVAFHL